MTSATAVLPIFLDATRLLALGNGSLRARVPEAVTSVMAIPVDDLPKTLRPLRAVLASFVSGDAPLTSARASRAAAMVIEMLALLMGAPHPRQPRASASNLAVDDLLLPLSSVERRTLEESLSLRYGVKAPGLADWCREVVLDAAATTARATGKRSNAKLKSKLDALERASLLAALARADNNQTRAAAALGMSRRGFIGRLEKYGLKAPPKSR